MESFRFVKAQHLRSKADFERVYALKCKAADGTLLMFIADHNAESTRIGLSVSKKHGGAVVRNRLKRLLREAFRLVQAQLPKGIDLIVIPLDKSRAALSVYQDSLINLSLRLKRRLDRTANNPEAKS